MFLSSSYLIRPNDTVVERGSNTLTLYYNLGEMEEEGETDTLCCSLSVSARIPSKNENNSRVLRFFAMQIFWNTAHTAHL
jgi:hypothetical protein